MNRLFRMCVFVAALALLLVPMLVACTPAAAPASPTSAPAKAPAAAEPAKAPAPAAAAPAPAQTKPAAEAPKPAAKAPSGDPIKIGYIASFSGFMSLMGLPEREVVMMMEEKINAEGGINGRPLKVIAYDDESAESKGVLAMKKVVEQDRVHAVNGGVLSGIAMAMAPIAEEGKVPFVAANMARAVILPPEKKRWIFKIPVSEEFLVGGALMAAKDMGYNKIAMLGPANATYQESKKYVEQNAPSRGFTIVASETFGPNDTDFTAQLTKIRAVYPDLIFSFTGDPTTAMAIRQAREMGMKTPFMGSDGMVQPSIMNVKELRDGLEGYMFIGRKALVYDQLPDTDRQKKLIVELDALLKKKYNRGVGPYDGIGADAFMVLVEAIRKANPDPAKVEEARQKIRDALETTKDFVGLATVVNITPEDHEVINWEGGVLGQVLKDGKFKLIKRLVE